jgi:hypothetical protein
LGKDDGVKFSTTLGEKGFRLVIELLERYLDNRFNRGAKR